MSHTYPITMQQDAAPAGPIDAIVRGAVLSLAALVVNILWLVNAFNKDVAAYTQQGRRRAGGGVLRRWRDHAAAPGRTPSRTASMEACPPRPRSRRP